MDYIATPDPEQQMHTWVEEAVCKVCRFEVLMAAGMEADRVTFNTLLKACMRGNLADTALHTFHHMQQLNIPVGSLELATLADC